MFKEVTPRPEVGPVQKHMNGTYFTLRWGLGLIAIAFPVLLVAGGELYVKASLAETSLENSLSAYYHVEVEDRSMRDWFVGTLFALGALMVLYTGFTKKENILLNIAGILAVCVAIFPVEPNGDSAAAFSIHGASALGAFACLALVAWFTAGDTLGLMADERRRKRYARLYKFLAVLLVASPLIAYVLSLFLVQRRALVLIAEALALWVFSAYWLLKIRELRETQADVLGLQGSLVPETSPEGTSPNA